MRDQLVGVELNITVLSVAKWLAVAFLASVLFSHTNALRFLLLFTGACAVAVVAIRARVGGKPDGLALVPPALFPFLLWMAWAGASMFWSQEPELSQKEFTNELGYTLVAFWFCYVAGQAPGAARVLGYGLGAAVAGVCLIAGYEYFLNRGHYEFGLHGGSGNLTSALITLVPCLLLASWLSRTGVASARAGALAWVCLGFAALGAYTTLNRTIWIALSIQVFLAGALILWRPHNDRRPGKRKLFGSAAAAAVVAVAAVVTIVQVQEERMERLRQSTGKEAVADRHGDPRLQIWPYAVDIVRERPWLGMGYGRGIARKPLNDRFTVRQIWHAHNLVLETAIQVGIPGAVLLLALIGITAVYGFRYFRSRNTIRAACGIAVLCIVTGMLLRNMTDVLWVRQNSLLYWGIIGMLFGMGQTHAGSAGSGPRTAQ
jgi:O-antigen ligase